MPNANDPYGFYGATATVTAADTGDGPAIAAATAQRLKLGDLSVLGSLVVWGAALAFALAILRHYE